MSFKETNKCNATSKRSKKQCRNPAMRGSSKCRHHGGKSLIGASHPNFKGGKHSRYLPNDLLGKYAELSNVSRRELLTLGRQIIMLDVQLTTQYEKLRESSLEDREKIFDKINSLAEKRRKMALSEARIGHLQQNSVPLATVILMLNQIVASIEQHLHNHPELHDRVMRGVSQNSKNFLGSATKIE